jgi:hypothetical protein
MGAAIRYQRFERTLVLVCGTRDPSNDEWAAFCGAVSGVLERGDDCRLLILSAGGGPNARQRKQLVTTLAERRSTAVGELRAATCGNAPVVRAVAATLGWMAGVHCIKSFRGEERDRALVYLGVAEEQRPALLAAAKRLEADLAAAVLQGARNDAR